MIQTAEPTSKLISGEELTAMGDIGRCELVEGKIVQLDFNSGEHGSIVGNISGVLGGFVEARDLAGFGGRCRHLHTS